MKVKHHKSLHFTSTKLSKECLPFSSDKKANNVVRDAINIPNHTSENTVCEFMLLFNFLQYLQKFPPPFESKMQRLKIQEETHRLDSRKSECELCTRTRVCWHLCNKNSSLCILTLSRHSTVLESHSHVHKCNNSANLYGTQSDTLECSGAWQLLICSRYHVSEYVSSSFNLGWYRQVRFSYRHSPILLHREYPPVTGLEWLWCMQENGTNGCQLGLRALSTTSVPFVVHITLVFILNQNWQCKPSLL